MFKVCFRADYTWVAFLGRRGDDPSRHKSKPCFDLDAEYHVWWGASSENYRFFNGHLLTNIKWADGCQYRGTDRGFTKWHFESINQEATSGVFILRYRKCIKTIKSYPSIKKSDIWVQAISLSLIHSTPVPL